MQTRTSTSWPAAGLVAVLLAGCSGGGSDPTAVKGTSGDFLVLRTTPPDNGRLFLNEPIAIDFSNPIDLDSADLNTVSFQVFDLNGTPLNEQPAGSFEIADTPGAPVPGRRLLFAPRFPTNDTYDNGGFRPGRRYVVQLVGGNVRNRTVLRDRNGKPLAQPASFEFTTADGTTPSQLFRDTRPGGPRRVGFEVTPVSAGGVALNEFSGGRVEVRLKFDQPLNPASSNVPVRVSADPLRTSDRGQIFLEYDEPGLNEIWIPATVDLEVNTIEGSEVVLRPVGILPNNATVRVIVERTVEDMSGESNVNDASYERVFATFRTSTSFPPQYDAVVERFSGVDGRVDLGAPFLEPVAEVVPGGIRASFDFEGGDARLNYRPTARKVVLNTDFTQITPQTGPPVNVTGGVFRFANVEISEQVEVAGEGSNPMVWLVTGDFTVNGWLHVDGGDGERVTTPQSANIPTIGGSGNAGGGRGGRGSPSSTDRSPNGEAGFGPGGVAGAGGEGGRLACIAGCSRASGGGGGSFTTQGDPFYPPDPAVARWDQVGGLGGKGCVDKSLPGGAPGGLPFTDSRTDNNFWGVGVNLHEGIRIQGELLAARGGNGGGGGGDRGANCNLNDPGFVADNKAGAGGGGAGVLIVKCLGKITIGPRGRISADGGNGGGGEQNGGNNLAGGGGGGSGGMVVLMAGAGLDIWVHGDENAVPPKSTYGERDYDFAITADGGLGAQSSFIGLEIAHKYPPPPNSNWGANAAGGFGGMGIVQLMVPPGDDQDLTGNRLDDNVRFLYRDTQGTTQEVSPERKKALLAWRGWPDRNGVPRDDDGNEIDIGGDEGDIRPSPIMLPSPFGALSRARSRWIDLGSAVRERVDGPTGPGVPRVVVAPPGQEPRPDFEFAGTSRRPSDPGYALFTPQGRLAFPLVKIGGLSDVSVVGVDTAASHESRLAYAVELGPEADLGDVSDRYTGYRLQILTAGGGALADFRILAHERRFVFVEPDGAFPAAGKRARILAKFFDVETDGEPGLGPTYSLGTGAEQAPIANVRIGFAFHVDPTEGRGPNRWPNATSPQDPLFEYDLSNPDFLTWLETHRPSALMWDVTFNARYHPTNPGNLSGASLGTGVPRPTLEYLVLPYRF